MSGRSRASPRGAGRPVPSDPLHVLFDCYLSPPSERSGVRRVLSLRDALEGRGIRTTVLTSTVSGRSPEDGSGSVVRAGDLRAAKGLRRLAGSHRRRWWSRLVVPDMTALSWAPAAAVRAAGIVRRDRPDAVFTSSPPESVHLVGLVLRSLAVPWVADFRDGWAFESPTLRPYAVSLDRRLERIVVTHADAVTTVTEHLAADLRARYGSDRRIIPLTTGFDPGRLASASDEGAALDPTRFSLVHTGTLGLNGKDPLPLLRALERLLEKRPELGSRLELVFAGPLASADLAAMQPLEEAGVVRILGELDYPRAIGLQQAADGLLLVTPPRAVRDSLTTKIHEYLAAGKPILALSDGSAADLLAHFRGHILAPPGDESRIEAALREYLERWAVRREPFASHVDLERFSSGRIARRLVDLLAEIGAVQSREL